MAVSTELIKKLREATGAGVTDCKNALDKSNGDMDKALEYLREKGLAMAQKRATRAASEGVVEQYSHGNGRVGVMVEVNCETDFVGLSPDFRNFAHEVALQIAAVSPEFISDEDIPADIIKRETDAATAKAKADGKPDNIIPRIVEGYLNKFKDEKVLLRQAYIRDETVTMQKMIQDLTVKLGEKIIIRRFVRWSLGESQTEEAE